MLAAPLLLSAAPPASLEVHVEGLRSHDGRVLVCLTRTADAFPDCRAHPATIKTAADADESKALHFTGLATGSYALALIHDENGNQKLDTVLGVPREGFGFSLNPRIRFGPPKFAESRFAVAPGENGQTVKVRYLL